MGSTELRAAAQQALEALEDMLGWQSLAPQTIQESAKGRAAALRAALAEPVQEPDSPERRCGGPGCDMRCCQPVQEPQGCAHCNHPLYAAVKCTVCGRVTEPVQEPVAWIEHEWAGTGLRKLHFEKRDPTVRDEVVNPVWTPLYTSPPQRKPLSEEEIFKIENDIPDDVIGDRAWTICFARAIERAHGIGGQP